MEALRPYVLTLLVNSQATPTDVEAVEKVAREWIETRQGTIERVTHEERRPLAYAMKHAQQATYTHLRFQMPPQDLKDLREKLARNTTVLRMRVQQKLARAEGKTLRDLPPRGAEGLKMTTAKKEKAGLEKLDEKIEEILEEKVL